VVAAGGVAHGPAEHVDEGAGRRPAAAGGDHGHRGAFGEQLQGVVEADLGTPLREAQDKAVSFAAYTALMDLFPAPARQAVFTDRMQSLYGEAFASDTSAPAMVGFTAAQAVLDFRHTDGSNQANGYADTSGYVPVNSWDQVREPDHWQPLCVPLPAPGTTDCPAQQKFATPHWRSVTPFALTSAASSAPTTARRSLCSRASPATPSAKRSTSSCATAPG
jgi:hypothetical protein